MDFTLPEVAVLHQKARFFKDEGVDFIEISYVGSKDTMIHRVQPKHMAQYREEWNAFCDGSPIKPRPGTPLTDLPSIRELRVPHYVNQNIHNLEELAALSDGQCQALGHGTLTDREATRKLLEQRMAEQNTKIRDFVMKEQATIGPRPADKYAGISDLKETNDKLDALSNSVAALVQILQSNATKQQEVQVPKRRGRPPKIKTEEPPQ